MTGPGGSATTAADGSYSFSSLDAGSYTVGAPATASGKALFTAASLAVSVAAGQTTPNNNFGYVTGGLSGYAYVDANRNGVKDATEAGLGGVVITGPGGSATTGGKALCTAGPLTVSVAAGDTTPNNNFGYVTGGLSGFAYVDANRNGVKDTSEAGIAGVVITGPGGTATTAADGSYSFS